MIITKWRPLSVISQSFIPKEKKVQRVSNKIDDLYKYTFTWVLLCLLVPICFREYVLIRNLSVIIALLYYLFMVVAWIHSFSLTFSEWFIYHKANNYEIIHEYTNIIWVVIILLSESNAIIHVSYCMASCYKSFIPRFSELKLNMFTLKLLTFDCLPFNLENRGINIIWLCCNCMKVNYSNNISKEKKFNAINII